MAIDRRDRSQVVPSELNHDPWWLSAILALLSIALAIGVIYFGSMLLIALTQ